MRSVPRTLTVVGLLAAVVGTAAMPVPAYAADREQIDVVLDISNSMGESDGGDGTKIEAAQRAVHTAVKALPDGTHLGLRTFAGCKHSDQVVPIGPLDRSRVDKAVDEVELAGDTPLTYALEQAANDFHGSGHKSVLLISDGEETCGGDPVAAARALAAKCVDVRVDVIGFRVDEDTKEQLRQVAAAGCGEYLDASDAAALDKLVKRVSLRAAGNDRPLLLWFGAAAVALVLLAALVVGALLLRRRRRPRPTW